MLICTIAGLLTCVAMEPYSALVHRVLWHGPLWFIHRTHHRDRIDGAEVVASGWVVNDLLSASHAPPAMALMALGVFGDGIAACLALGAALGMIAYGALYALFHDGMVHGRLPVAALSRVAAFSKLKAAHVHHHRTNAAPYGFFASALMLRVARERG